MKKFLVVLTITCLILALSLPVFAETSDEWRLSNDLSTLSCGEDTYTLYSEKVNAIFYPICLSIVAEYVSAGGAEYDVGIYDGYTDVVYLLDSYSWELCGIYVKGGGAEMIDGFLDGAYTEMRVIDGYTDGPIDSDTVAAWNARADERIKVDVTELESLEVYDIASYDASLCLAYVHGALYVTDDGYLYVNYDELDNSYFDSEGNFSYRRGEVSALLLTGDDADEVKSILSEMEITESIIYDETITFLDPAGSFVTFVILWVLLGIGVPMALIVVGILLARTKKPYGNRHWYVLSLLGAVWIAAAVAALVILMV